MKKQNESQLGEKTTGGTTIRLSPKVRAELRKRYGRMSPNDAIALLLEQDAEISGASLIEVFNAFTRRVPLSQLAVALAEIGYSLDAEVSADRGKISIQALIGGA